MYIYKYIYIMWFVPKLEQLSPCSKGSSFGISVEFWAVIFSHQSAFQHFDRKSGSKDFDQTWVLRFGTEVGQQDFLQSWCFEFD